MKEMNRRAFLTLTGAALAMMALTACDADDVPVAPPAPPAPPAPAEPTGKEDKVLEAINLFRKEMGWGQLNRDSILNNAAERYADFARGGELDEEQLLAEVIRLDSNFGDHSGKYVNIAFTNPSDMRLYYDDVAKMKEDLLTHNPEYIPVITSPDPKKLTLVGIKVFTYLDGKEYWYAFAAEGKK